MRLALVHDYLNQYGGAERVLENLHAMYPAAPVYTSMYAANAMPAQYREMDVRTSFMQRLPAGFAGKPWRQTDGAVFSVVEGSGSVMLQRGEQSWTFEFGPRDHFVIPSWHTAQLQSQQGCVLFSFSDRPVHQALGIHREERLS